MSIVNSVSTYTGEGWEIFQNIGVAIVTTAAPGQVVPVPKTGSFSPTLCRGMWRCKFYAFTSAITITSVQLSATDGTNTVTFENFVPVATISITATAYVDTCGEFIFDSLPSATAGGGTGTLINFGATLINFNVVSATASGACSGDFEIAGAG